MNRVYKHISSKTLGCIIVVPECARGAQGKKSGKRRFAAALAATTMLTTSAWAQELPTGGRIVSGSGTISQSGNTMTINQSTGRMIANWGSFSVGAGNSVTFNQPGASSVALNRVVGQNPSQILGSLNANGQVFLVNPNGIVVGRTGSVQTGGFVASTLGISNADFLAGNYNFKGSGGSISNQGSISGNVVALISPTVTNAGTITGDTALAAGTDVLLDFDGDGLLSVEVKASTVKTLVENKGLIKADGGTALLTAKGASEAMKGVVNNSGTVQAKTLARKNGRILLLGDMKNGEVKVTGKLDASAPKGGDGGFIETSAKKVTVTEGAVITTNAVDGATGTWLIDPNDYTIAATGGDITGAALSSLLAGTNITIESANGATPGNGDIFVNDTVAWSANRLTLSAHRDIEINAAMRASGTAGLALEYGQGAAASGNTATYSVKAPVNLASTGSFSTKLGSDGATIDYTIITSLGAAGEPGTTSLQGIKNNLSGNYVLGADIDASGTSTWHSGAGFEPIGAGLINLFSGTFDGLGHTTSNLYINRPGVQYVGLFGVMGESAAIRNASLTGASITGGERTGALVGLNWGGVMSNSYAAADVSGGPRVGGLVGSNIGVIKGSHADGNVSGTSSVGGLAGSNTALIEDSYADSEVSGTSDVGGLVGGLAGTIRNSHAAGDVTGVQRLGGLVGSSSQATIETSHASGNVTDTDGNFSFAGGLVGSSAQTTIRNSYATGNVEGNGGAYVGGLVGVNSYATIEQAYATGTVSGNDWVGGLAGQNDNSTIANSYATGDVQGHAAVGGLVGENFFGGTIRNSYATGNVVASVADVVGGLVGSNGATVENSFWDTDTTYQFIACGTGSAHTCGATGLTTTQALTQASYGAFDFSADWFMVDGYTRPFGRWEYSTTITNTHQLQLMAMDLGADYVLTNDIDFGTVFTDGTRSDMWATMRATNGTPVRGFVPIGGALSTFVGTFDGDGHTIAGLVIDRPGAQTPDDHIGLFGWVGEGGVVRNVGLQGGSVKGNHDVGALVGTLSGTLENSFASTSVQGDSSVGGLVGTITTGTVRNSFATGSVSGADDIGGLAGTNQSSGTIATSYAAGNVDGTSNTGGLVGRNAGTVTVSFYSLSGTGQSDAGKGVGLTAGEMNNPFTFIDAGWNFSEIWGTPRSGGAPLLRGLTDTSLYDYYVRLTGDLSRTYGDADPNLGGLALDGIGVGNVALNWGGAITAATGVGTYGWSGTDMISLAYSTGSAGDYYVDYGTGGLTIVQRVISLSGGRTYDGTTDVAAATFTLDNLANGEVLTLYGAGSLSDKNAEADKIVSLGTLTLGDGTGLASNYTLAGGTYSVDIARAIITSVTGITAASKTYDSTTAAMLDTSGAGFTGMVAGDTLTVATAIGAFTDKNAGAGKTVNVTGLTLGSADARNYTLADATAKTTADIGRAVITGVIGIAAESKIYDGSTAAVLDTSGAGFVGMIAGDRLTVASAEGAFDTATVGRSKTVTISRLSLGGVDAGNYVLLNDTAFTEADIAASANSVLLPDQLERSRNYGFDGPTSLLLNPAPVLIEVSSNLYPGSCSRRDVNAVLAGVSRIAEPAAVSRGGSPSTSSLGANFTMPCL